MLGFGDANYCLTSSIFLCLDAQSREFKYNRQAFDQKARSMTEKYATGSVCDTQFHSNANPITVLSLYLRFIWL